jgi:hypothetical protein
MEMCSLLINALEGIGFHADGIFYIILFYITGSCAVSVDQEILNLLKNQRKPAIKLLQYTCNVDKANYGMFEYSTIRFALFFLRLTFIRVIYAKGTTLRFFDDCTRNIYFEMNVLFCTGLNQ